MLLEDRNEIAMDEFSQLAVTKFGQLVNFIETVERDNYCDPEQFLDAQKTLHTLIQILNFKLDYVSHGY